MQTLSCMVHSRSAITACSSLLVVTMTIFRDLRSNLIEPAISLLDYYCHPGEVAPTTIRTDLTWPK